MPSFLLFGTLNPVVRKVDRWVTFTRRSGYFITWDSGLLHCCLALNVIKDLKSKFVFSPAFWIVPVLLISFSSPAIHWALNGELVKIPDFCFCSFFFELRVLRSASHRRHPLFTRKYHCRDKFFSITKARFCLVGDICYIRFCSHLFSYNFIWSGSNDVGNSLLVNWLGCNWTCKETIFLEQIPNNRENSTQSDAVYSLFHCSCFVKGLDEKVSIGLWPSQDAIWLR